MKWAVVVGMVAMLSGCAGRWYGSDLFHGPMQLAHDGPFHPWGERRAITAWLGAHGWCAARPTPAGERVDAYLRCDLRAEQVLVAFDRSNQLTGVVLYQPRASDVDAVWYAVDLATMLSLHYGPPTAVENRREIWALPTGTEEIGVATFGRYVVETYRVDLGTDDERLTVSAPRTRSTSSL